MKTIDLFCSDYDEFLNFASSWRKFADLTDSVVVNVKSLNKFGGTIVLEARCDGGVEIWRK